MTSMPDGRGYFGKFGGRFVPETLINALKEIEEGYASFMKDEFEQNMFKKTSLNLCRKTDTGLLRGKTLPTSRC